MGVVGVDVEARVSVSVLMSWEFIFIWYGKDSTMLDNAISDASSSCYQMCHCTLGPALSFTSFIFICM